LLQINIKLRLVALPPFKKPTAMDIATLATAAFTLATPYIVKSGEALAESVGQEIWNVIKKPFTKNGKEITKEEFVKNKDAWKSEVIKELEANTELKIELEKLVQQAKMQLDGNFQQNVNSYGEVQKQINIQSNTGNITM
jgi:hypothetical protein